MKKNLFTQFTEFQQKNAEQALKNAILNFMYVKMCSDDDCVQFVNEYLKEIFKEEE